jgi:lysophospholipase L1-like esterase
LAAAFFLAASARTTIARSDDIGPPKGSQTGQSRPAEAAASHPESGNQFQLRSGDRVVLIGSTLIERDQMYGYLETALTTRFYDRNITFRNLGWSGDTVWGDGWAMFGSPADGFRDRLKNVVAMKPTVIVLGFGTNESFAGKPALPHFVEGLNTLLDALAKTGARIVIFSPTREENLGRPLPDPAPQNERLAIYTDAMRQVAKQRGYRFVDLFTDLIPERMPPGYTPLTDDEMHLTEHGYQRLAEVVDTDLFGPRPAGPTLKPDELEALRHWINKKNELSFHRWRPENFTYLYLFRAHEQPGTAAETPDFEPLVLQAEAEIAKGRQPRGREH